MSVRIRSKVPLRPVYVLPNGLHRYGQVREGLELNCAVGCIDLLEELQRFHLQ